MAPPASLRGVDIHSMSHPIPFPSQNWKFVNDLFPESGADWPNVFEVTVTGIPATPALSQVPEKGKAPQKGPTKEQTGPRLLHELWSYVLEDFRTGNYQASEGTSSRRES